MANKTRKNGTRKQAGTTLSTPGGGLPGLGEAARMFLRLRMPPRADGTCVIPS